jgi:hypothetical protein
MLLRNAVLKSVIVMTAAALPASALAGHVKAGLWQMTNHMHMPMAAMMTPDQAARMQAMGVHIPTDRTTTTQYCVSAADAASDKPPPVHSKDCSMSNVSYTAAAFTADMVCSGSEMQGSGHVSVAFDGDRHYSGNYAFNASREGRAAQFANSFEAKWLSADCGAEK